MYLMYRGSQEIRKNRGSGTLGGKDYMVKQDNKLQRDLDRLSVLTEPARRALYAYVSEQARDVGRDEAAKAVGLTRQLAAFHLDRLAKAGLLEISYRRLSGRAGPGAGRPSKLYRRSRQRILLTLAAAEEPVTARILARAMEQGESLGSLERAARSWGVEIGRSARERAGADATPREILDRALDALGEAGFDPRSEADGSVVLGHCPFDASKSAARVRICHMNLALCQGLVEGLAAPPWSVRLEPAPDRCCAVFRTA